jgi:hypothetical protein
MAPRPANPYHLGMNPNYTPLERAFALARSGEYLGPGEIRAQLKAEGYSTVQLEGKSLMKQLRDICNAARAPSEA